MVFQSRAELKGSRRETPQGTRGTAAEGCTPAACTLLSRNGPVAGRAGRAGCTHLSPRCGSHFSQRRC